MQNEDSIPSSELEVVFEILSGTASAYQKAVEEIVNAPQIDYSSILNEYKNMYEQQSSDLLQQSNKYAQLGKTKSAQFFSEWAQRLSAEATKGTEYINV